MSNKIFTGKTDVGLKRQNNEDVFLILPELDFCLVADGMGGAAAGEVASKIFADATLEIFSENHNHSEKDALYRVQKAYSNANGKIFQHISAHPDHKGMGQSIGDMLHGIVKITAKVMAITQQPFKVREVLWCGNNQDFLDTCQHQNA